MVKKFEFYIDHRLPHLGSIYRSQHCSYSVISTNNHVVDKKTYFFKLIHDSGRFVRALLSNETFRRLNKNPKLSGSLAIPLSPRSSSTKSTNSPNLSEHKIIYCYRSGLAEGPPVLCSTWTADG